MPYHGVTLDSGLDLELMDRCLCTYRFALHLNPIRELKFTRHISIREKENREKEKWFRF